MPIVPVIAAILLALSTHLSAQAESEAAIGGPDRPLRFATMELEPYGLPEQDEMFPGLFREVNASIARGAGLHAVDQLMPLKRMLKSLERGERDCGILLLTPYLRTRLQAVAEIRRQFDSLLITRRGLKIDNLEQLRGYLLGLPRGSYVGHPVADDTAIRRLPTNGYAQSAILLQAGRVDAIAGSGFSVLHNLGRLGMRRSDVGSVIVFDSHPLWLQCVPGRLPAALQSALAESAARLQRSGRMDEIFARYRVAGFE